MPGARVADGSLHAFDLTVEKRWIQRETGMVALSVSSPGVVSVNRLLVPHAAKYLAGQMLMRR